MRKRIECHGLGPSFAPVARALSSRGLDLSIGSGSAGSPLLLAGSARIMWQDIDDPAARAHALEQDAQDVVGPWMHQAEAVARIIRLTDAGQPMVRVGDMTIALVDRRVERNGRIIPLLGREYEMLLYLARRPHEPVDRRTLLKAIWRLDFDPGTNSVEVHMSRLRSKLDRGFATPMLLTIKGRGYALCPPPPPLRSGA